MIRILDRLQWRRWLHSRRRGQGAVEFSLIVISVAIVGIASLSVLGKAEEGYFIPLQNAMAPTAPVGTGDVVHAVEVTIVCSPTPPTKIYLGTTVSGCSFTVRDKYNVKRTWPQGSVRLLVNGVWDTADSCPTLIQDTNPADDPDEALSTCAFTWSPTVAGSFTLTAQYFSTDGKHGSGALSTNSLTFNVPYPFDFKFVCTNPWLNVANSMEVGQPLFCTLTVKEQVTGTPAPLGLSVIVTADSGNGYPYFTCFTNDPVGVTTSADPSTVPQHAVAFANMTNDPGCVPQQLQPFTCTVDATGLCTRHGGTTSFVYRRNYFDNSQFLPTDHLTATAPLVSQSGSSPAITIGASASPHQTKIIATCNVPPGVLKKVATVAERSITMLTDTQVQTSGALNLSCAASVVDIDPNTDFDYPSCIAPFNTHCNIDYERPHAPLGQAVFEVYDHNADAPHKLTPYLAVTCPLAHLSPVPGNVPVHPFGAWFHASWCALNLPLLTSGDWDIDVHYAGYTLPSSLIPEHGPSDGASEKT